LLKAIKKHGIDGILEIEYEEETKFGPITPQLRDWVKIKMEIWRKISEIIRKYDLFHKL